MAANESRRRWSLRRRALPLARVRTESGKLVCERCEIADRPLARMRGLLGRKGLEPGGGMLLTQESSVHMFFMHFPIDVVFLDRDRRVVSVRHQLQPWRMASARRAVTVLELPAGAAAAAELAEGDVIVVEDLDG